MLFLVATPIGNLGDITLRAIETLQSSDLILCEDTRHTIKLLNHYKIKKPLKSYHKFNEASLIEDIVGRLKEGANICLVSDSGTPLISDPGYKLVERCVKEGLSVSSLPGPCAAIDALLLSGFETLRFQFVGFLPRREKELKNLFIDLLNYAGVSICYESPERVGKTLNFLAKIAPETEVALARELTKKFEEILRGTALELASSLQKKGVKGECVLLIKGNPIKESFEDLSEAEHVALIQKRFHLSELEAIKMVAELRHTSKRTIYNKLKR